MMRDTRGMAVWVMTLFMALSLFAIFQGGVDLYSLLTLRTQLTTALTTSLQEATVEGARGNNGVMTWNASAARTGAAAAIAANLPVTATTTNQGAVFTPYGAVPSIWQGPLQLEDFQVSTTPGVATLPTGSTTVPGPYIAAALTLPVTFHFFGLPIPETLTVTDTSAVYAYDGQVWTTPR